MAQFFFNKGVSSNITTYTQFASLCVENDDVETLKTIVTQGVSLGICYPSYGFVSNNLADIAKSSHMREYLASKNIFAKKSAPISHHTQDPIALAFDAVRRNDFASLAPLLSTEIINAVYEQQSLLHVVDSAEMVNFLLDHGADIQAISEGYFPQTPLERACFRDHFAVAIALLKRKATIKHESTLTKLLYRAVAINDYTSILELIACGVSINSTAGDKPHVFYHAQTPKMVHFLFDNGALAFTAEIAEGEFPYICSPLHKALMDNNYDVVQAMLQIGFNVNVSNHKTGLTPLHIAAEYSNKETVELLLSINAKVMAKMHSGKTTLHMTDSSEIADLLIAAGADINAITVEGQSPLSRAYEDRHFTVINTLQRRGASLNQGKPEHFPLDEVALWGDPDKFTQLLQLGAQYAPSAKMAEVIQIFNKLNYNELSNIAEAYAKIFALWKGGELLGIKIYEAQKIFNKQYYEYKKDCKNLCQKELVDGIEAMSRHNKWISTFSSTLSDFCKVTKTDLQFILKALLLMRSKLVLENRAFAAAPLDLSDFHQKYYAMKSQVNTKKRKRNEFNLNDDNALDFLQEDPLHKYNFKNNPWYRSLAILHYFGPKDYRCIDMRQVGAMGDHNKYSNSLAMQLVKAIQQAILESQTRFNILELEINAYKEKIRSLQATYTVESRQPIETVTITK